MKLLLDTHVFLWMISNPEKLSKTVKEIIETEENEIFLSSVSGFEIAIKYQIDKLKLPENPDIYIPRQIKKARIKVLPVKMNHALNVHNLPHLHKDPFDRLLISQSQLENIPLATDDAKIKQYPLKIIW
jgi:PIN domain nuclease of toxin-antitoxin system